MYKRSVKYHTSETGCITGTIERCWRMCCGMGRSPTSTTITIYEMQYHVEVLVDQHFVVEVPAKGSCNMICKLCCQPKGCHQNQLSATSMWSFECVVFTVSVMYSRTSHNGPSEKWTTSLQWTKAVLRIEYYYTTNT